LKPTNIFLLDSAGTGNYDLPTLGLKFPKIPKIQKSKENQDSCDSMN